MTLVARKVLLDCVAAHDLLKQDKKDNPNWRVHWVSCLALLRAVGHVLAKVDNKNEPQKAAIAAAWEAWEANKKEHSIFWDFIDRERNNLLKQYLIGVTQEHILENVTTQVSEFIVDGQGNAVTIEELLYQMSLTGYEGQEGRDVIGEAIEWWERELSKIEATLVS